MSLTPRQERFVDEYLIDLNATQAARRAGYSDTSAKSLTVQATRLLAMASVREAVASRKRVVQERLHVSAEDITLQAWRIASNEDMQASSRVSALALLAKRHPEFSDKHDFKVDQRSQALIAVSEMPLEQLIAIAEGLKDED